MIYHAKPDLWSLSVALLQKFGSQKAWKGTGEGPLSYVVSNYESNEEL